MVHTGGMLLAGALGLAVLAGLAPVEAQGGHAGFRYEIRIECPLRADGVPLNDVVCPVRAADFPQYLLGSPSMAVDPTDPANFIFHALHDQQGDGPSDRSRAGTPFTTFVSSDNGATWYDNYYPPPASLRGAFGEHSQATATAEGGFFVGSLYAVPDSGAPTGFTYTLVAQKFGDVFEINAHQDGEYGAQYLDPVWPDNVIQEFWYVYDPATRLMTVVWDEVNPNLPEGGFPSVIGMAWTTPDPRDPYHYIEEELLIGPCLRATNPVLAHGSLYVGCLVDHRVPGYRWDATVHEGQIDLFRVAQKTGQVEYLGETPVSFGTPRLAVRDDGAFFLVSAGLGADGNGHVTGAFGVADPDSLRVAWRDRIHLDDVLEKPRRGKVWEEVSVQAVVYRDSGAVHLLTKERFNAPGLNLADPEAQAEPIYRKRFAAYHPAHGLLANINLDVGNWVNRTTFNPTPVHLGGDAVFNDLVDSLVQLPPGPFSYDGQDLGSEYKREFFAVGDYGVVQVAEVVEIAEAEPVAAPAPAAVPALASPAAAAQLVTMGVVGGALAGLLVLKLALSRRRTAVAARAGQK